MITSNSEGKNWTYKKMEQYERGVSVTRVECIALEGQISFLNEKKKEEEKEKDSIKS